MDNGIIVSKLFLNISKKEQKVRFLERIEEKEKNWKFSAADVLEPRHWDEYMAAYEDTLNHTSTDWAPWFIVLLRTSPGTGTAIPIYAPCPASDHPL